MKQPRIPGTHAGRTLFVLPLIPDDLEPAIKNAIAIRNEASVTGTCPDCGVEPELHRDLEHDAVFHLVFRHEAHCHALTDEAAA